MSDRPSPNLTTPIPAARHDAVTRMSWVERHLKWLYWACAAGLAPWIVYLYLSQVPRAQAHQIRLLAVGLILAMIAGLLLTAWTYRRGLPRSMMAASFAATAAFISAWFRTLTQAGGSNWAGSIPTFIAAVVIVVVLCVIVIRSELSASSPVRWLPIVLTIAALALIPSLVVVLTVVPRIQTAHHLRVAWSGLDMFEVLALASTGFALQRRPAIAVIPATITGTLLLCDAWLNIIPSTGVAFYEGVMMAFIELPLAALSFWVAAHVSREQGARARVGDMERHLPKT
jgi:hypothetical protein